VFVLGYSIQTPLIFVGERRQPLVKGRLSTIDLLVLTGLDHLIFILKTLFTFVTKHATSIRRSIVLSLPSSVSVPWSVGHPLGLAPTILTNIDQPITVGIDKHSSLFGKLLVKKKEKVL
jgi:hypothetical protein